MQIRCEQCKQSLIKASWYRGDLGAMEASWNKRIADIIIIQQTDRIKELEQTLEKLINLAISQDDDLCHEYHNGITPWSLPKEIEVAQIILKKELK